jgi:hypothetical protein
MTHCANLNFGGAGAWRLPTEKELMAAYEHGIYTAPNANWLSKEQMAGAGSSFFWSSTTRSDVLTDAAAVVLNDGNLNWQTKTSILSHVICVR